MPPDILSPRRALLAERIPSHWREPLLRLALAWAVLLALFAEDWAAMAMQWWDSSTYNHILLVPAIIAWLIWQRSEELAKLTPRAWWPGLLPLVGGAMIWLLGDISGLGTANHLGAVVMLQSAAITLLGPRVSSALLFPLAYALFLVPVGDELVPALQMITADITIALTEASGIPAHIEGVFIDTPAGLFEVAEACSGVKFLVAMIALGTLVAHVCFCSWPRRAIFMALAVALPILANGVRAWGTIFIAQSKGIEFAAGFDHIFYGWIFFALVMAALLAIGWRFFDRSIEDRFIDGEAIAHSPLLAPLERWSAPGWHALAAIAALALLTLAWSAQARSVEAALPAQFGPAEVPGWTLVDYAPACAWEPRAAGADRKFFASYRDPQGRVVDVVLALYAAQEDGREAGAFGEGALPPEGEWRWLSPVIAPNGGIGDRLQALGVHQRLAMTWFRNGEWTGGSRAQLKLRTMRDRLLFRQQPTMMLILSAEEHSGTDALQSLADFRASAGPLGEWMDRSAGLD